MENNDMAKNDKVQNEENKQQQSQGNRPAQQRQVRFVEEGVKTNYAGIFNIGFGSDEVVFIFGNPSVEPNLVRIDSKVAVSLKTAKRMAVSLGNLIRRYEAANGAIDIASPRATSNEGKTKIQ
jgi:hypothetical protein